MSQKASASSRVPGASAATRSTTSRQNSAGMAASNAVRLIPRSARDGMAPPLPGSGNQRRWKCRLARVMAASKRMIEHCRATHRMVWMTASRTSARVKSSCAVSFHG